MRGVTDRHRVGNGSGGGLAGLVGGGSDTATAGNTYRFGDIIMQGAQKDGCELADETMGHVAREMRVREERSAGGLGIGEAVTSPPTAVADASRSQRACQNGTAAPGRWVCVKLY